MERGVFLIYLKWWIQNLKLEFYFWQPGVSILGKCLPPYMYRNCDEATHHYISTRTTLMLVAS